MAANKVHAIVFSRPAGSPRAWLSFGRTVPQRFGDKNRLYWNVTPTSMRRLLRALEAPRTLEGGAFVIHRDRDGQIVKVAKVFTRNGDPC